MRGHEDRSCAEILEAMPVMIGALSVDLSIRFWNAECERVTGWSRSQLVGKASAWPRLFPGPLQRARLERQFRAQGASARRWECAMQCPDGSPRVIAWSLMDAPPPEPDWVWWAVGEDVTELHRSQAAQQISESFYQALVDVQDEAICRWLPDTTLTYVNPAYCRLIGRSKAALLGTPWLDLIPQNVRQDVAAQVATLQTWPRSTRYSHLVLGARHEQRYVEWRDTPIFDANGTLVAFQSVGMDITELKGAEKAFGDAGEQKMQRLGQELHDGVMQQLTAVSFLIQAARGPLRQGNLDQGNLDLDILGQAASLVDQTLAEVRQLARQLLPITLQREGLVMALEELASVVASASPTGCQVRVEHDLVNDAGDEAHLDAGASRHLYRIAQEAVRNALQHGQAPRIDITLRRAGRGWIELLVCDDGMGCPDSPSGGLGLESMQHRAYLLDGYFAIGPNTNGGTVVSCRVPVERV